MSDSTNHNQYVTHAEFAESRRETKALFAELSTKLDSVVDQVMRRIEGDRRHYDDQLGKLSTDFAQSRSFSWPVVLGVASLMLVGVSAIAVLNQQISTLTSDIKHMGNRVDRHGDWQIENAQRDNDQDVAIAMNVSLAKKHDDYLAEHIKNRVYKDDLFTAITPLQRDVETIEAQVMEIVKTRNTDTEGARRDELIRQLFDRISRLESKP